MAFSAQLGAMGIVPAGISTSATVSLEKLDQGWAITKVHLDVAAKVPSCNREDFEAALNRTKETCPVSRCLCREQPRQRRQGVVPAHIGNNAELQPHLPGLMAAFGSSGNAGRDVKRMQSMAHPPLKDRIAALRPGI